MRGVTRAIRHTQFAPGDLYLDPCFDRDLVRPLSGQEKWDLTELSAAKSKALIDKGLQHESGPLAGNSIPLRMTDAVMESEMRRLAQYQALCKRQLSNSIHITPPLAGLHNKRWSATFLIFLGLAAADVLVWDGSKLPAWCMRSTNSKLSPRDAYGLVN